MHLDLVTVLTIISTVATIGFGVYSVIKAKPSRRSSTLLFVLIVLYLGQLVGAKVVGQPLLSPGTFSGIVIVLVGLIFGLISQE